MSHRWEKTEYGDALVAIEPWSGETERAARLGEVHTLVLSRENGWDDENLDFLSALPDLRNLIVLTTSPLDASALQRLTQLETLVLLAPVRLSFPLWDLPRLEDLAIPWHPGAESVFECRTLRRLMIRGLGLDDLDGFSNLTRLEVLRLVGGEVRDFSGLGRLPALRHLLLAGFAGLTSLEFVRELPRLEELTVKDCANLGSLQGLSEARVLKKLQLPQNGPLASLSPVAGLTGLEECSFGGSTEIVDGDLSVLAGLPRLRRTKFVDRPHYSHRQRDL